MKLTKATQISRTLTVKRSAIRAKECAVVLGTSADKGQTVKANRISLTPPMATGCARGFRRSGG